MCNHLVPPSCLCLCTPPKLCLCCYVILPPLYLCCVHIPKYIPFISSTIVYLIHSIHQIHLIHFIDHRPSLSSLLSSVWKLFKLFLNPTLYWMLDVVCPQKQYQCWTKFLKCETVDVWFVCSGLNPNMAGG